MNATGSGTRVHLPIQAGVHRPRQDGVDPQALSLCSDAFQIGCDDGDLVGVASALECCGREAESVATTSGVVGDHVQSVSPGVQTAAICRNGGEYA